MRGGGICEPGREGEKELNYVIIGGSAAGISAIEAIRKRDKESKITVISDEKFPLYSRCLLSYYLAGEIPVEKLHYKNEDFFTRNKVIALLGKRAEAVNAKERVVNLANGDNVRFDKLLIATGGTPQMPELAGAEKKGLFCLRTVKDAQAIRNMLGEVKEAVVLGGGLIGLKAAYALAANKIKVAVVVRSSQILSQTTDQPSAEIIERHIAQQGITVMKGRSAKELKGGEKIEKILLDDGSELSVQLVVVGKGVKPNIDLVKDAGVETDWGIKVNEFQETNVEGIFAAGDCAETFDLARGKVTVNALWPLAVEQGRVAGLNMSGEKAIYDGSVGMNSIDFFGRPIIACGVTRPKEEGITELVYRRGDEVYKKLLLKDNKLIGMVLVGEIEQAGVIHALMKKQVDVSDFADRILEDSFNFSQILPLVKNNSDKFTEPEFVETVLTFTTKG